MDCSRISNSILLAFICFLHWTHAKEYDCEYKDGNGVGKREYRVGKINSPLECANRCIKMRERRSEINGVIYSSRYRACYCIAEMMGRRRNSIWRSCFLVEKNGGTTQALTIQARMIGFSCSYSSGFGHGGSQYFIGSKPDDMHCAADCFELRSTKPNVNGASFGLKNKDCICESNMRGRERNYLWKSCFFELASPTQRPTPTPIQSQSTHKPTKKPKKRKKKKNKNKKRRKKNKKRKKNKQKTTSSTLVHKTTTKPVKTTLTTTTKPTILSTTTNQKTITTKSMLKAVNTSTKQSKTTTTTTTTTTAIRTTPKAKTTTTRLKPTSTKAPKVNNITTTLSQTQNQKTISESKLIATNTSSMRSVATTTATTQNTTLMKDIRSTTSTSLPSNEQTTKTKQPTITPTNTTKNNTYSTKSTMSSLIPKKTSSNATTTKPPTFPIAYTTALKNSILNSSITTDNFLTSLHTNTTSKNDKHSSKDNSLLTSVATDNPTSTIVLPVDSHSTATKSTTTKPTQDKTVQISNTTTFSTKSNTDSENATPVKSTLSTISTETERVPASGINDTFGYATSTSMIKKEETVQTKETTEQTNGSFEVAATRTPFTNSEVILSQANKTVDISSNNATVEMIPTKDISTSTQNGIPGTNSEGTVPTTDSSSTTNTLTKTDKQWTVTWNATEMSSTNTEIAAESDANNDTHTMIKENKEANTTVSLSTETSIASSNKEAKATAYTSTDRSTTSSNADMIEYNFSVNSTLKPIRKQEEEIGPSQTTVSRVAVTEMKESTNSTEDSMYVLKDASSTRTTPHEVSTKAVGNNTTETESVLPGTTSTFSTFSSTTKPRRLTNKTVFSTSEFGSQSTTTETPESVSETSNNFNTKTMIPEQKTKSTSNTTETSFASGSTKLPSTELLTTAQTGITQDASGEKTTTVESIISDSTKYTDRKEEILLNKDKTTLSPLFSTGTNKSENETTTGKLPTTTYTNELSAASPTPPVVFFTSHKVNTKNIDSLSSDLSSTTSTTEEKETGSKMIKQTTTISSGTLNATKTPTRSSTMSIDEEGESDFTTTKQTTIKSLEISSTNISPSRQPTISTGAEGKNEFTTTEQSTILGDFESINKTTKASKTINEPNVAINNNTFTTVSHFNVEEILNTTAPTTLRSKKQTDLSTSTTPHMKSRTMEESRSTLSASTVENKDINLNVSTTEIYKDTSITPKLTTNASNGIDKFQTTNVPERNNIKKKFSIKELICEDGWMMIVLKFNSFVKDKGDKGHNITLTDERCQFVKSSTSDIEENELILETEYGGCGSTIEEGDNYIAYRNQIIDWNDLVLSQDEKVYRATDNGSDEELHVQCKIQRNYKNSLGGAFKPKHSSVVQVTKTKFGKMSLSMSLYKSSQFDNRYITREFPVVIDMKDDLYVELAMNTTRKDLLIAPQHCYATITDNPDAQFRYSIFKERCPRDTTFIILHKSNTRMRFQIKVFDFLKKNKGIFMHCTSTICEAKSPHPKCEFGCEAIPNDRKNRRMMNHKESISNEVFTVSSGYIEIKDQEWDNEVESSGKKGFQDGDDGITSSTEFLSLLISLIVITLIAVISISAAVILYKQKRRDANNSSSELVTYL